MDPVSVPFHADGTPDTVVIDGVTYRAARVDGDGRQLVAQDVDADDLRYVNANYSSAQTNASLITAPGAGLRVYVLGIVFSTAVAGNFQLDEGGGGAVQFGPHYFPADGGISFAPGRPICRLPVNTALRLDSSIVGNHSITILAAVAA